MKAKSGLIGLVILILSQFTSAADINGRLSITTMDSSKVAVLLQMNTVSGAEAIGGATIVIGFDTAGLSFPACPIKNLDYTFHNFCGSQYSPATITRPLEDRIWVNIDLPYLNSNNGTLVSDTSGWTDILTIYFNNPNSGAPPAVHWLTGSPFWSIYKDNNMTLMNSGTFQNISWNVPVELTSFTAEKNNNSVVLSWSTGSEVNNNLFEIQRSIEGSDFSTVGTVKGTGTTSFTNVYSYTDSILTTGKYSYRLKQVDFQGSFAYSDILNLYIELFNSYKLEQNYPNPFNPSTRIIWESPVSTHNSLKVYDILGNEVAILVDEVKPAGRHEIVFNSDNLASGVYICRLQTADYSETKKMILLR